MFRKRDKTSVVAFPAPYKWSQENRKVIVEDNNRVIFEKVTCDDICDVQLDREAVNLDVMLKNGVVLDPARIRGLFDSTDSVDLERFNNERTLNLYNYIKANEDKFIEAFTPKKKEV